VQRDTASATSASPKSSVAMTRSSRGRPVASIGISSISNPLPAMHSRKAAIASDEVAVVVVVGATVVVVWGAPVADG
jgi:hypothetical protein